MKDLSFRLEIFFVYWKKAKIGSPRKIDFFFTHACKIIVRAPFTDSEMASFRTSARNNGPWVKSLLLERKMFHTQSPWL